MAIGYSECCLETMVIRKHYAYYGITGNSRSIDRLRTAVLRAWRYVLMRRGNRNQLYWA